ncbi:MAG: glycosyltransferase family 4 protein [Alphaproteobacteria bacterium]|nr:glycosyltransferase family 4 protein [Alphaproteobacteria bacterium]
MSSPPSGLAISWVLATISGYGIYGLQILLQFLRRSEQQAILTRPPAIVEMSPLQRAKLEPAFQLAKKLDTFLRENPKEILSFRHAVLHGSSSNFAGFEGQDRIWGQPNVACCAIEHLVCNDHGRNIAKNYDMFIAISHWNEAYLKSLNVGPVHLCYQGIDGSLFHPGPSSGLYKDRFVIFSGGKLEFRKGQDIVLAAFKRFYAKHPDALLVTCWQNLVKSSPAAFELAGHISTVPELAKDYGLQMTPWLLQQGLPPGSFIDLPFTHNLLMPGVLRDCDMAVFPNRCEGGTNLVAMEAMACGVPTYVSYNTGQKDLVDLIGCGAFKTQRSVKPTSDMMSVEDWGETDVDEVVAAMEYVYNNREDARREAQKVAANVAAWEWGPLNEKLLEIVCDGKTG